MIELENLRKQKPGGSTPVLDNVSAVFSPGRISVICGPSGAGKSTLLNCILQLETPDAGIIRIFGNIIAAGQTSGMKNPSVGGVLQNPSLFQHMTVLENLTLAPRLVLGKSQQEANQEARSWLDELGIPDKEAAYPHQLSGGEYQRVSIARALAMTPKVLVLDEPTTALNQELIAELVQLLRGLSETGMTIVISTHDLNFAQAVGDHWYHLENGALHSIHSPLSRTLSEPSPFCQPA